MLLVRNLLAGLALGASVLGLGVARAEESAEIFDHPLPELEWGYAPAVLTVAPGAWVTWSNAGSDVHNVVALDGSFDSGELLPSEGFSWYFDAAGTFGYVCTLHPWMHGQVVVEDAVTDVFEEGTGATPEEAALTLGE